MMAFQNDFLWGAATAAPQIEGAFDEDGKTPSIWDVAPAGKIKNGENCHVACDHYHHVHEDVALMKELGIRSYRFSISWPRIMPSEHEVNPQGLAFYKELVDELVQSGIEPLVTIYHWDLPVWVYEKGGWLSKRIIPLFEEYTRVVVNALSDKVRYWIVMNEPQCFIMNGYMAGAHAPFKKKYLSFPKLTRICLQAFQQATKVIREQAVLEPKIGIAMAAGAFVPEEETSDMIEKAKDASFSKGSGLMSNRWWGDPLINGKEVRAFGIYHLGQKISKSLQTKLDFIGLNVYSPFQDNWYGTNDAVPEEQKNQMGWVNDGRSLYWAIRFFHERYGLPILVTENGTCVADQKTEDGKIHDSKRIRYMEDYLSNLTRAVEEGIPVLGYQYWSLMDNFEWAEGYDPRFGLIYVDFKTQERIPKDSFYYYQEIIRSNGKEIQ